MKTKLIESGYNEETGISYAKIQTPKGIFVGHAKLNFKEEKYPSKYIGCDYAEARAELKYLKYKIKEVKKERATFFNFYCMISQSNKFDPDNYEAKQIEKRVKYLKNKINELNNTYNEYKRALDNRIKNRTNELDQFYKKSKDKKLKILTNSV